MSSSAASDKDKKWQPHSATKNVITIFILVVIVIGIALMRAGFTFASPQHQTTGSMPPEKTVVTNGANQWIDDEKVTMPNSAFSLAATREVSISPLFAHYYQSHGAAQRLGNPLTVAFPTDQGWLQFFEAGHCSCLERSGSLPRILMIQWLN